MALTVALFVELLSTRASWPPSVVAATGRPAPGGAQTSDLVITIGLPLFVAVAGACGALLPCGRLRDADLAVAGIAGATPYQQLAKRSTKPSSSR